MKQRTLLVLIFLLSGTMALNAQVSLTATSGTTTGSYTTLGAAFANINNGTHQGVITITLTASTNEGNTTAKLYYSGYNGTSNYTSINIYPIVSGVNVLGNRNAPMIDFDGADNVTVDGRVNATGLTVDLVISNSNTSWDNYTSTIRFINGATNNTIKYCKIQGSTCHGTSGILCFGTTAGVGNSNNTVDNNAITNANGLPPFNAIFSNGTTGNPNSSNTISNNNIYDVWNILWTHTYAINLSEGNDGGNAYNSGWTINGNSFYQTIEYVPIDPANQNINIIYINAQAGTGFNISNNYLGGSTPLCGGTWIKTRKNNSFNAISLNAGTGTASNIQGNTIKNFNYTNEGSNSWTAIGVGSGDVNIGTTAGNCIGGSSGTGSILFTADGYQTTNFTGIYVQSSGNVQIQNNSIGSITTNKTDQQYGVNFYGIYLNTNNSLNYSVSNNTIGSTTTANGVDALSASTASDGSGIQKVAGILLEGNSSTASISISNNTVANLTNGTTNATTSVQGWIYGIAIFQSSSTISGNLVHDLTISNANNNTFSDQNWRNGSLSAAGVVLANFSNTAQTISGNTIYNISNSYSTFTGHIAGLFYWGGSTASSVSKNLIYGLSVNSGSTSANIHGIKIGGGIATYSNNIITLGGNTATTLNGIYEAGSSGTSNIYFNTVYLNGSPPSGSCNSYALYNAGGGSARDFRNNIFFNARSNGGGSAKHYAIYIAGVPTTMDYNDYLASGTGGVLGYYSGDQTTLLQWQNATSRDSHSLNTDPSFASAGGTSATDYIPSTAMTAVTGTGITTDYGGSTRSVTSPEMGAWEQSNTITWNGNTDNDWSVASNWSSSSVPTSSTNVSIPAIARQPHVTAAVESPAVCNNLTIGASAVLTIDPGKALTVNGTFTNSAGNSGLVISSDGTGTGSLIQGSSSVGATVQRYITGSASLSANMYHFVSIPVNYGSPTSNLFLGSYLYKLDPAQIDPGNSNYYGLWINLGNSTTTPLSCNMGYMIYYPAASNTYTFTGNLNTGSFSPTVSYGGTYTFNLIPNPYPSAINWGASGGWVKSNIGATAYIWPAGAGNYTTITASNNYNIPVGQSFIVMTSGSPTLTVNNSACVHSTQAFYKSTRTNTLRISAQSNNYYDETFVGFDNDAGSEFDPQLDGFKLWGLEEAPQLWTEKGASRLSINKLPAPEGALVVPLDFKTSYTGQVILDFSGVDSFDPSLPLRLEDHLNGSMTDLRQNSRYIFSHDPSSSEKRFSLVFGYPNGIKADGTNDGKIWIAGRSIYINPGDLLGQEALVEVFNLPGQKLYSVRVHLENLTRISSAIEGMVIVRLTAGGKTCTARGFIH